MSILNDQQIIFIESQLREAGIQSKALHVELLDHICCAVETKMHNGYHFHQAVENTFLAFGDQGLKDIQTKISNNSINRRILHYSIIAFLFLAILSALFYWFNSNNQQPPSIAPVQSKFAISSSFGPRVHPVYGIQNMHDGVDIKVPSGSAVVATANGQVLLIEETNSDGQKIVVKHNDTYMTVYSQLSEISVKEGQQLKKGDVIGFSGIGNVSTGAHLHYEVIENGKHVDPKLFFAPNLCCAP